MPNELCVLVCSYLENEVRAALDAEALSDVQVANFAGDCDDTTKDKNICANVPDAIRTEPANLKVLGGACQRILVGDPPLPSESRVDPQSTCFEILIGVEATQRYIREGVHLLVPAMVRDWRTVANGWGFDAQTAKTFFAESGSRLVLLDTGIGPSCADNLRELSDFTGLDIEVVPVTLDYARQFLSHMHIAWKLESAITAQDKAYRRIADLTLADELIKNLASEVDEEKIIDAAIELFSILCAPQSVHYQSYKNDIEGDEISRHNGKEMSAEMVAALDGNVEPLKWVDACNGLMLLVSHMGHIEGALTVEGVALPSHAKDYLELARTVMPILGLAVFNARTHKRLSKIEPDLLRYQNELEIMVEERTAELTQEIAEKKRAEGELQELEDMYEDLYDNAPDMFVSVDAKTKSILQCNRTLADKLGYNKDELIGQPITFAYHPDCMEDVEKAFQAFITTGEVSNAELQLKRKDGSKIHVILNVSAVRDDDGNILHSRSVWRDITDRKEIEDALADAKEEAERASNAKSEFLAAMSHDLRTPLNAIMGFSDMMRARSFGPLGNPHYEQYANDIYDSGTLLISLINDILDLSKIEAGKYELSEVPLDLFTLIEVSFQQLRKMAESTHLTLLSRVPADLPALRGDERALIQVFNNLLSNAIKFTPEHGSVDVSAQVDEGGGIIITFADSGIGMSQDDIVKALRPFEQADGMHSRKHEGTGLGLHLCINIMNLFGGTLDIESEVGLGTKVSLHFPPELTCTRL
ncbi:PAS domain-containing sensor histidine kinase [Pseudomonadota bacterium]